MVYLTNTFNQTNVELKSALAEARKVATETFNQTNVELK